MVIVLWKHFPHSILLFLQNNLFFSIISTRSIHIKLQQNQLRTIHRNYLKNLEELKNKDKLKKYCTKQKSLKGNFGDNISYGSLGSFVRLLVNILRYIKPRVVSNACP